MSDCLESHDGEHVFEELEDGEKICFECDFRELTEKLKNISGPRKIERKDGGGV